MNKTQNIGSSALYSHWTYGQNSGVISGASGNSSNAERQMPVWANVSGIKLVYLDSPWGYTAVSDNSDVTVSPAIRPYTGSTPKAPWQAITPFSLPAGTEKTTPLQAVSLSYGDTLRIRTHALATTAGKPLPATRGFYPPHTAEGGTGLTPSLAGAALPIVYNVLVFTAAAVLGKTDTKQAGALGHSLIYGAEPESESWVMRGTQAAGRGCISNARGASLPINIKAYEVLGCYASVIFLQWVINDLNGWAYNGATAAIPAANYPTDATLGTPIRDQIRTQVRRLKAFGTTSNPVKVVLCTEGFGLYPEPTKALQTRAAWNAYVRANYNSYMGADAVFDVSPFLETALDNGVPISYPMGDLHWGVEGHAAVGAGLAASITSGALAPLFAADGDPWNEYALELFQGAAGADGVVPSPWYTWAYFRTAALALDGTGNLKFTSAGDSYDNYAIYDDPIAGRCRIFAVFSPLASGTNVNQGVSIGFCSTNGRGYGNDVAAQAGRHEGIVLRVTPQNAYSLTLYPTNAAGGGSVTLTSGTFASYTTDDVISLLLERDKSGSNNTFRFEIYKNGVLITSSATITQTSTPAAYQGGLYPMVATAGNTATTPPNGANIVDMVRIDTYNPVVIDAISAPATMQVLPGSYTPFQAVVTQSFPVAGPSESQTVTATLAGIPGGAVSGSKTTNISGIARWAETSGILVPDTVAVGTTATVTLACGAATAVINLTVVASISGGGSGSGSRMVRRGRN